MGVVCSECRACLEEANKRNKNKNNNRTPISSNQNRNQVIESAYRGGTGSGSKCYTCNAKINQRPETGRDDFRIQINAQHHGDHTCDEQTLTMVFNYPATFISCSNGRLDGSNNTTRIKVKLRYHNNQNDNIGMGDFIVKSAHNDLEIVNCFINDGH